MSEHEALEQFCMSDSEYVLVSKDTQIVKSVVVDGKTFSRESKYFQIMLNGVLLSGMEKQEMEIFRIISYVNRKRDLMFNKAFLSMYEFSKSNLPFYLSNFSL